MQPLVATNAHARHPLTVASTRTLPWKGEMQLLTESPRRLPPIAGTIHAGAKVLTKANAQKPELVRIYQEGISSGRSYDEIERDLEAAGGGRNPLRMINMPYFNVRRGDFRDPAVAQRLIDLYGTELETSTGTKRRLQRFPIMFPTDDENLIIRHSLAAWSASSILFWSESREGERVCMTKATPKSGKRVFGGRENIVNPERPKCNPNECPVYQANSCNLTGALQFYVPGIQGTGLLRLPTRSFYALDAALAEMELVRARHGTVAGLIEGKPFFYITKQRKEVSWLSPDGPTRVWQDIIVLESDMDMIEAYAQKQASYRHAVMSSTGADSPSVSDTEEIENITVLAGQLGLSFDDVSRYMTHKSGADWAHDELALESCTAILSAALVDDGKREELVERVAIMTGGVKQ